jgi:hypothetical protein
MVKAGYFLPWEQFDAPELVWQAKLADDRAGEQRADAAALAGRLRPGRVRGRAAVCLAPGAPWPAALLLPLLAVVAAADLAVDQRKPRGEPG